MQDKQAIVFHQERFKLRTPFQFCEMIKNGTILLFFSSFQSLEQGSNEQQFHQVMDSITKFRGAVRQFALNANNILYQGELVREQLQ